MSRAGSKGMSGHQRPHHGKTNEWLTPQYIVEDLGPFDLDPCAPVTRPWSTAAKHYTIDDDGLSKPWHGKVWLNPPYGPDTGKWLERLAEHGNGCALVFARTETDMFFTHAWYKASGMLFLKGRLHFHYVSGERAKFNAGAPSVIIAYGKECNGELRLSCLQGRYINLSR